MVSIRGIGVEPHVNPNLGAPEQPQTNNVRFDLLHPQQVAAPTPPPPPTPAPVAPAPMPVAPPPPPAPVVQKVGTTQQPNLGAAPSGGGGRGKLIAIILAIVVLLGGGAAAAYFFFFNKPAAETPVAKVTVTPGTVSNLAQSSDDGVLQPGAVSKASKVTFAFDFVTTANTGAIVPEVEIQPLTTHFTDQPTITGEAVSADGHTMHLTVTSAALTDGQYHWQARIRVGTANGPWEAFDATSFSFGISGGGVTALAAPIVETVGGTKVAAAKVSAASSKPVFTGTSVAGAAITVTVKPEGLSYTATADNSGAWTVTPTDELPNGDHTVTVAAKSSDGQTSSTDITVSVNPVAVSATPTPTATPTPDAATPAPTPEVVATSTPTPSATLAPTGDPVLPISILALVFLMVAILGLRLTRHAD